MVPGVRDEQPDVAQQRGSLEQLPFRVAQAEPVTQRVVELQRQARNVYGVVS